MFRYFKISIVLIILSVLLLHCVHESMLSEVEINDPSVIRPEISLIKAVDTWGNPTQTIEVWLFDKNDIQTVTKVVMSESAFHDVTTHDRLSAKGDPVLVEVDRPIILETAKLRLQARIVDLTYGDDPMLPENSYFNQVTLELAIWPK